MAGLTTTDKLPVSDRVSDLVRQNFFFFGGGSVFQPKGKDTIKPFINGGLRNDYCTLAGFAFSYSIIAVVPGDFSLGC